VAARLLDGFALIKPKNSRFGKPADSWGQVRGCQLGEVEKSAFLIAIN